MTSDDLTAEQVKPVADAVCRHKEYLYRLRERMQKRGIADGDPLYAKVQAAYDAVFSLWIDLHYRGCGMQQPKHL